jgi:hypothetical protein
MHITMVKKIKEDGSSCRKCAEIEQRLKDSDLIDRIDHVVIADERDSESEGLKLATQHNVERAPFFIVEEKDKPTRIYTVYFQFVKEILTSEISEQEEVKEIMEQNPDLDFL